MKFFIVDAFTEDLFGGNTAGIVLLPLNAEFPLDINMQRVATELRYSETAFVKQLSTTEFQIRYFTPAGEVDLCGHATIASFKVLCQQGIVHDNATYTIHTQVGNLAIQLKSSVIFMDMSEPQFLSEISDEKSLDYLYSVMGLSYVDQLSKGLHYLPQIISTGLPDIMLPVHCIEDLESINPNFSALAQLSKHYNVIGVHAFTLNGNDATAHVRNFAPLYDIDEESATGTSNGALTYYGYRNGFISDGDNCVFVQGEKMNRKSRIYSQIKILKDSVKIQVGGKAIIVAEGELNLK